MKQLTALCIIAFSAGLAFAEDKPGLKRAFVDGNGAGWRTLTKEDFTKVNSAADTWSWKDGVLHCTGQRRANEEQIHQFRIGLRVDAFEKRR